MFLRSSFFVVINCLVVCKLCSTSLPPEPLLNYCPVVVVNNTTLASSILYFVANALDPNGIPCFLKPDTSTGICSYVYPNVDGTNGSYDSSVTLDQLPVATNTGISGTAYLIYLPVNSSARAYFSVNKPMYLSTTFTPGSGSIAINSPAVTTLGDPNYFTLYQDFEFGVGDSDTDSSTKVYINLSWVDYFCLPMQLYANSYTATGSDPTINNAISTTSGMPLNSTREGIITTTINTYLSNYSTSWGYLPVPYYTNPYSGTTSSDYVRILAAKNSIDLANGRIFQGNSGVNNFFPSTYVNGGANASGSNDYMHAVYNYYNTNNNTLYAYIHPGNGFSDLIYAITAGSSGILEFSAYTTAGVRDSQYDTSLNLYTLPADQLFSGGINTFPGYGNNTPIGAELGKLISALYSIGQLPFMAFTTSLSNPFYNVGANSKGYESLTYFTNPSGYTNGPWYNYYDLALHKQMVGQGSVQNNPTLGLAYGYDYDDLLLMSGIINGLYIQDQYANPSQATGASNPYVVIQLESLSGTTIPDPFSGDTNHYNITVLPASSGVSVSISYTDYNTHSPTSLTVPASGNSTIHVDGAHPVSALFSFNEVNYNFDISLLQQYVVPSGSGSTYVGAYTGAEVQYLSSFVFSNVSGSGPYSMTLQFNSSPPPWGG